MTTQLATVDFHGYPLITVNRDGEIYVALKPMIEHIGLDWEGQRQRIQRDEVLSGCACVIKVQMPGDDQRRDVLFLPLQYLNGWLFGIDTNRILNDEVRRRIVEYKRECYEVLYRYWHGQEVKPKPKHRRRPETDVMQSKIVRRAINRKAHDVCQAAYPNVKAFIEDLMRSELNEHPGMDAEDLALWLEHCSSQTVLDFVLGVGLIGPGGDA